MKRLILITLVITLLVTVPILPAYSHRQNLGLSPNSALRPMAAKNHEDLHQVEWKDTNAIRVQIHHEGSALVLQEVANGRDHGDMPAARMLDISEEIKRTNKSAFSSVDSFVYRSEEWLKLYVEQNIENRIAQGRIITAINGYYQIFYDSIKGGISASEISDAAYIFFERIADFISQIRSIKAIDTFAADTMVWEIALMKENLHTIAAEIGVIWHAPRLMSGVAQCQNGAFVVELFPNNDGRDALQPKTIAAIQQAA